MPSLDNRNSIIEALRSSPATGARLWVEAGRERASAEIIDEARKAGVSVRVAPSEQFARRFRGVKSHVCLEIEDFAYADADALLGRVAALERPLFAVFDGIYDPQNLGNAVRTAACFGFDALFIPRDNACGLTETVANVARGGAAVVAVSRVTNLHRHMEALKKRNVFCFGLDERADITLFDSDLTVPLCLVLGGEKGLRRLTRNSCDMLLRIPTAKGFPSLNVASAFAVAAYEATRQRGALGLQTIMR
jgi:23S rRNA (guanosine2251-2'-O)-methyltransferase